MTNSDVENAFKPTLSMDSIDASSPDKGFRHDRKLTRSNSLNSSTGSVQASPSSAAGCRGNTRPKSGAALQTSKLRAGVAEDISSEIQNFRTLLSKQVSDEVYLLRSWIDLEVVQRVVHIDRSLRSLQKQVKSIGTYRIESGQDTEERCDSRSLQMPGGDVSIDMDYDISSCNSNGHSNGHRHGEAKDLWTLSDVMPQTKAGPPTAYSPSVQISGIQVSDIWAGSERSKGKESEMHVRDDSDTVTRVSTAGTDAQEKLINKMHKHRHSAMMNNTWTFLDDPDSSSGAKRYLYFMICVALLAVCASIAQSLISEPLTGFWAFVIESLFEIMFLLEFLTRLAACPDYSRFICNMFNMFDLAAGLPFAIRVHVFLNASDYPADGNRILSNALIGVVPMLRVLKTVRRFKQFQLLLSALSLVSEAIPICLFALLALTLSYAAMIFMVEPRDNIISFPHSMWFVIVTMTTLGYGDVFPSTTAGYLIASAMVVSSVLFMAMPLGIIGQAFTTVWQDRDRILLVHGVRSRLKMWGYKPEDIPLMFELHDEDRSGDLDFQEFKVMIDDMGMGLSDVRVVELFKSIDEDGEGTIDVREFVQALFPELLAEEWKTEQMEKFQM